LITTIPRQDGRRDAQDADQDDASDWHSVDQAPPTVSRGRHAVNLNPRRLGMAAIDLKARTGVQ
jgi:hypothetical protein